MEARTNLLRFVLMSAASGALLTTIAVVGIQAIADQNPTTDDVPRVIPYSGIIEVDGVAVDDARGVDALWMRFDIRDDSDDATPIVYSQRQQVEVYKGRFQTLIGPVDTSNVALEDVIAGADNLSLHTVVLNDPSDDGDDIVLSNPQRLLATPYVLWATNAVDFSVGNDMDVTGTLNLRTTDTHTLSAPTVDGIANINAGGQDFDIHSHLRINGDHSSNGDTTAIAGDLSVASDLTVTDRVSADGSGLVLDVSNNLPSPTGSYFADVEGLTNLNPGGPRVTFSDGLDISGRLTLRYGSPQQSLNAATPLGSRGSPFTGDTAWAGTYNDDSSDAANKALQFGIGDDSNDDIQFYHGGTQLMTVSSSQVRVRGALAIGGILRGDRLGTNTDANSTREELAGNARENNNTPGDWRSNSYCGADRYLCGMRVRDDPNGDGKGATDIEMRCCIF